MDADAGGAYNPARGVRLALLDGNTVLLIEDDNANTVLRMDLVTGRATIISGNELLGLVGTGPSFGNIIDVAVVDGGSALVVDTGNSGIMSVGLVDGTRAIVSDATTGTGPDFREVHVAEIDMAGSRALIGHTPPGGVGGALVAVDLMTGNRTVISDATNGSGPALPSRMTDLVLDLTNNRALVLGSGQLLAVDLTSGDRTEISPDDGVGPGSPRYFGMTLDAASDRVLVCETEFDSIRAIDLTSGARMVISDGTTGTGTPFEHPVDITLDGTRALVWDAVRNKIVAVDLATGNRTDIGG
ncbi:MAG: hypothetical protein JRH11_26000 [Deltaproteobacteria bacterium]|nr:hypothetical protein [Deltaproteobacteria bacterium]